MKYLLDTDTCIYLINRRPATSLKRLLACRPGEVGVSSITAAELRYGADKSLAVSKNQSALDQFLIPLEVMPFGEEAAKVYGAIRSYLERKGAPIGALDTLIGAHALSLGAILVTNNTKEFKRIPDLVIDNWTR